MLQLTKQGDELMMLAVNVEAHLREQGHDVTCKPNSEVTAFEIRGTDNDVLYCRVQAVGEETFEIVRTSGETLSGFGGEPVMFTMLGRVVKEMERRAA